MDKIVDLVKYIYFVVALVGFILNLVYARTSNGSSYKAIKMGYAIVCLVAAIAYLLVIVTKWNPPEWALQLLIGVLLFTIAMGGFLSLYSMRRYHGINNKLYEYTRLGPSNRGFEWFAGDLIDRVEHILKD